MGISRLYDLVNGIATDSHIKSLKGRTLGIDASILLHRGARLCATELVLGTPTTSYLFHVKAMLLMLAHFDIRPYFVFDGSALPAKHSTIKTRELSRDDALERGHRQLSNGSVTDADRAFKDSARVTSQMKFQTIKVLRAARVDYIVAPYEADAQLACLDRLNLVDAVYSEDSDLLVFGVRLHISKLQDDGSCRIVSLDSMSRNVATPQLLMHVAFLAGCDYSPGIPGLGVKKAASLLAKGQKSLKIAEGKVSSAEERLALARDFTRTEAAYQYQTVFDPVYLEERPLHAIAPDVALTDEAQNYAGWPRPAPLARGLATGIIDSTTLMTIVDQQPNFDPKTDCYFHDIVRRFALLREAHTVIA